MTRKIRLLIVDDSSFVRSLIRTIVQSDKDIEVVGEAANGAEAVTLARQLSPNVITMDVRMPGMDGVEATRAIMAERPVPILMLSSFTEEGAPETIRALRAGAVEAISKSSSSTAIDIPKLDRALCEKLHYWGGRTLPAVGKKPDAIGKPHPQASGITPRKAVDLVAIGVSTGGPAILPAMLRACGKLKCPVVIGQHMSGIFTGSFASTLRDDTGLDVVEGHDGLVLDRPMVVVLPGSKDGWVNRRSTGGFVIKIGQDPEELYHPSANVLFRSALDAAVSPVAVLMTGMGRDGAREAARFAEKGFPMLAQTPDTCVVSGMPQSAIDLGAASHILDIEDIGACLRGWCGAS
jgi:two-component system, chemotaxis family, protein-glutamate methylesterase/glutaminase